MNLFEVMSLKLYRVHITYAFTSATKYKALISNSGWVTRKDYIMNELSRSTQISNLAAFGNSPFAKDLVICANNVCFFLFVYLFVCL